jgi:hypothetical protein
MTTTREMHDMSDETKTDIESDEGNVDAGGKAHTSSSEDHPAGDGERTDRDVGGPKSDEGGSDS